MEQFHVDFLHSAPAFAMIAGRARRDHICPNMFTPQVARDHMVNRHASIAFSTILTGIIVAAKHLAPRQLDVGARPMNLMLQSNHGRARQQLFHGPDVPAPVHDHTCLACVKQPHRSPRRTNIDRFKIGIKH
jgi:hypothetical protein